MNKTAFCVISFLVLAVVALLAYGKHNANVNAYAWDMYTAKYVTGDSAEFVDLYMYAEPEHLEAFEAITADMMADSLENDKKAAAAIAAYQK